MTQLTFIFPDEDSEVFYTGPDGAPRKGDLVVMSDGGPHGVAARHVGEWVVQDVSWEYGIRGLMLIAVFLVEATPNVRPS